MIHLDLSNEGKIPQFKNDEMLKARHLRRELDEIFLPAVDQAFAAFRRANLPNSRRAKTSMMMDVFYAVLKGFVLRGANLEDINSLRLYITRLQEFSIMQEFGKENVRATQERNPGHDPAP